MFEVLNKPMPTYICICRKVYLVNIFLRVLIYTGTVYPNLVVGQSGPTLKSFTRMEKYILVRPYLFLHYNKQIIEMTERGN